MKLIMYFIGFVLVALIMTCAILWTEQLSKEIDTPEWKCPYEKSCE